MTEKMDKEMEVSSADNKPVRGGVFKKFFIFILFILIAVAVFVWQNKPEIFVSLFERKTPVQTIPEEITDSDSTIKDALSEEYIHGPDHAIPVYGGEIPEEDDEADTEEESPYAAAAEDEKEQQEFQVRLNDYRVYLSNINKLVVKFIQDQEYYEELTLLQEKDLTNFEELIIKLEDYNSLLQVTNDTKEEVKLFDSKLLQKFIKISKNSADFDQKKKLKAEINQELDKFIEHLFSPEFQQEFLK